MASQTEPSPRAPDACVKVARIRRAGPIFVCGKCLKRAPEGKALRQALKDAAAERATTIRGRARKPRIVRTSCLGLCPKRAVAVASPATLAAGEILIVRDVEAITDAVVRLLPGDR